MASITEARRLAREALVTCGFQGRHEDVLLVVSELVTNALVHGDGSPVLRVRGSADRVRIEVGDAGAGVPRTREPGPASGWGGCTSYGCCRPGGASHPRTPITWVAR
ncbi:ATP-binding protein [Nonomuraea salmonea]|uniref:ATP-binding protein n=1 Tax=Nonomuraea salmonea TaxID=46181 RepID=UPI0031F19625